MGVVLVDLDDTLIPDRLARDQAMRATLAAFGSPAELEAVWPIVRQHWRLSGLTSSPALAGVSSWEALWTDLPATVTDPAALQAAHDYPVAVWRRLLPAEDPSMTSAAFRREREARTVPFPWAEEALGGWSTAHDLWCVTNGSSWLQRRKLALAGLSTWFSEVVISGEVGADKSQLAFHERISARLAQVGEKCVAVVGDSAASDGALATFLGVPHVRVEAGLRPALEQRDRVQHWKA